jgi:hypothetical protein
MTPTLIDLDRSLRHWAGDHGIVVRDAVLGPETPGSFDGPSITINPVYDPESQAFILAHSVGSVVVWTLNHAASLRTYDDLRATKQKRDDEERFEKALVAWTAHEEAASEYAVGLLTQVGHVWAVDSYTTFARADLAMMVALHRGERPPIWEKFFPEWRRRVERGELQVRPYFVRLIPTEFRPTRISPLEVYREEDGQADD